VTIARAIINIPSVIGDRRKPDDQWDLLIDKDKKIGYVRVTGFNEHTPAELSKILEQLKEDGGKALILDLRDDPGGLLSSAVEISDMFLDKGEIVSTKGRNTRPRRYEAQRNNPFEDADIPMVVMVNQNSASASEIVAAALQDHKRAAVVGQRSYGKGSVQNMIDLEGGNSILKLTVASYYRPSGENIHRFKNAKTTDKWGVSPNSGMEVKLAHREFVNWFIARRERDRDALAKGHRKTPQPPSTEEKKANGSDAKPAEKADAKKTENKAESKAKSGQDSARPFVDKQLDKALEVIKTRLAEINARKAI
jgi:carboxyl-terminal processing protease